jgi:hypothetical protein
MKFLVDEMPFWETDCPFYDGCDCTLDNDSCDYMKSNAGHRCAEDCRWLKVVGDNDG